MKRLVYSYLANVNIENTNWNDLIIQLVSVFDLPKSHLKYIAREYFKSALGTRLAKTYINGYRAPYNGVIQDVVLPMVTRVQARTIAMDLVSVQALPAPKIKLHYIDFTYGPKLNLFQKIIGRLKKLIIFVKNMRI